jgi:hypothetical protein
VGGCPVCTTSPPASVESKILAGAPEAKDGGVPATTGEGYAPELGTGSPCRWQWLRRSPADPRDNTVLLHGNESDCVYNYGTTPVVEAATGQTGVPGRKRCVCSGLSRWQRAPQEIELSHSTLSVHPRQCWLPCDVSWFVTLCRVSAQLSQLAISRSNSAAGGEGGIGQTRVLALCSLLCALKVTTASRPAYCVMEAAEGAQSKSWDPVGGFLLLLRVRRLGRVSKEDEDGLWFKMPCCVVCVGTRRVVSCRFSGRLVEVLAGTGMWRAWEFCGNCMLTLERNQIWQEPRAKCRANSQLNPDAATCSADSV